SCLLNGGDWRDFISGPLIVTEATSLSEVFRAMRQARSHMAVVADEFGGTAGIVTMEDILEELVGEIRDEHDRGQAEITELAPGELLVDGSARLADVYERLGVEEPDVDVDTVAGLLFELTGRIPSAGETVDHEGIRFVVEESDGQHVEQVRVVAVRRKQGGER
ncbi:MAG: CBS domain-containing protein, partial [Armatimonadetes bacterium]|nr:CBS domain-containing protein [Armatimonadota bacterium]